MNLSGILVTAEPSRVQQVLASLVELPGVEVRQHDVRTGRIVVVQEASDVGAEVDGFMRIRGLPHVVCTDLVCHCLDADDETQDAEPSGSAPALQP
jgi:nitrate reductase NapAB chaperone NapD